MKIPLSTLAYPHCVMFKRPSSGKATVRVDGRCVQSNGGNGSNSASHQSQQRDQHQQGQSQSFPFSKTRMELKSTKSNINVIEDDNAVRLTPNFSFHPHWTATGGNQASGPGLAHSLSQYDYRNVKSLVAIPTSRSFLDVSLESADMQQFRLSPTVVMSPLDDGALCAKQIRIPRSNTTTISSPSSQSYSLVQRTIVGKKAAASGLGSLSCLSPMTHLRLSTVQKQALLNTWRIMKDNSAERITEKIFHKMISSQPSVRDVFQKVTFLTIFTKSNSITTCRDHARLLVRLFNDLVANVDSSDAVLRDVRECGMKHVFLRQSDLKADIWEKFGEAAIEVISEQDCVKANSEAAKAWTILIASLTDEMRHGFEKETRRRSYAAGRPKSACE